MREARRHLTLQLFFRNSLTLTTALGTASALALSGAAFAASNEATNQTSNSMSGNSGAAGPSAQDLMNSQNDASNWILPAGDYSGNRLVKEKEIGPSNVDQMQVAWTFNIPQNGAIEIFADRLGRYDLHHIQSGRRLRHRREDRQTEVAV